MAERTHIYRGPAAGVFSDRDELDIHDRGIADCRNVRIKDGKYTDELIGWSLFTDTVLNGPVTLLDEFRDRQGTRVLILGTPSDLYVFNEGTMLCEFITPRVSTGSAAASGTSVTGSGTAWDSPDSGREGESEVQAGDEIAFGASDENDPEASWFEIASVESDTGLTLTADAGTVADGDYTIRQKLQGASDERWQAAHFLNAQGSLDGHSAGDDLWYATNGARIVSFAQVDTEVTVLDLGFHCKALAYHQNMLIAGNITESGVRKPGFVKNSAIVEPENFSTKEASEFNLTHAADGVQRFMELQDVLVVYGRPLYGSTYLVQFVGEPVLWAIRTAIPEKSPLSPFAVMLVGNEHRFLAADGLYIFNGIRAEPYASHVFKTVSRETDGSRGWQSVAHYDVERNELNWIVPRTTDSDPVAGGPETSFLEHLRERGIRADFPPITVRDFPAITTGYFSIEETLRFSDLSDDPGDEFSSQQFPFNERFSGGTFPATIFGGMDGRVYRMGTSKLQAGKQVTSFVRWPVRPVHDPRSRGMMKWIEPLVEMQPGSSQFLLAFIEFRRYAYGPSSHSSLKAVSVSAEESPRIGIRRCGRFASVLLFNVGSALFRTDGYGYASEIAGDRV